MVSIFLPSFGSRPSRCHKSLHSAGGDELFAEPGELGGALYVAQLPHLETERLPKTHVNLVNFMRIEI